MIDVYAAVAPSPTSNSWPPISPVPTLMAIENGPDIPMFRQNTTAFIHELAGHASTNADLVARVRIAESSGRGQGQRSSNA